MIGNIQIRNPRVREVVAEEVRHGAGRNAAEAASTLILEAAERRRIERAKAPRAKQPGRRVARV